MRLPLLTNIFVALFCCIGSLYAQIDIENIDSSQQDTLIIAVKESPPFTFKGEGGSYEGISVQLWEQIARKKGWAYKFRQMSLAEIVESLENGSIDLAINPLTVTSKRIQYFDFTQPFYVSNSVVATVEASNKGKPIVTFLQQLFSWDFVQAVLALIFTVFIFGVLMWWVEKNKEPTRFEKGWEGVWSGIWWSAATMTTVGYGDKVPHSVTGRILGLIWMFTAIVLISGFIANITSSLTIEHIQSDWEDVNDLRQVHVGSVKSSASESFLFDHFIKCENYIDVSSGLEALQKNDIEALVYDEPILRYQIEKQGLSSKIKIQPFQFNTQYYGFGAPLGSELISEINPILLEIIEDVRWKVILSEYDLHEL